MLDYAAAQAVAMVVRTGSFEGAARALSVTPSAISQRVRNLENRVGAVLIERGTPCRATETGVWLCRHLEQVSLLEAGLREHLPGLQRETAQAATISIATNADSLGTWFLPALTRFGTRSGCLVNVVVDDEDHTTDWLHSGRVTAAVTATAKPVQGCAVRPLGHLRYVATASPEYLKRHFPAGVTAEALCRAPALTFNLKDRLQHAWIAQVLGHGVNFPTHWLPSTHAFVDGAVAGLGWGLNPLMLVDAHLAAGRLIELVPGARLDRPLYWQINRISAPQLSDLTCAVVAAAREALVGGADVA